MSMVATWECDRCGMYSNYHPYSLVIVQVNESGEPVRLEALPKRYKDLPKLRLCRTCAEKLIWYALEDDE